MFSNASIYLRYSQDDAYFITAKWIIFVPVGRQAADKGPSPLVSVAPDTPLFYVKPRIRHSALFDWIHSTRYG